MKPKINSTVKVIALYLLYGGRVDLSTEEIRQAADKLGTTTRSIYRYINTIAQAQFLIS